MPNSSPDKITEESIERAMATLPDPATSIYRMREASVQTESGVPCTIEFHLNHTETTAGIVWRWDPVVSFPE